MEPSWRLGLPRLPGRQSASTQAQSAAELRPMPTSRLRKFLRRRGNLRPNQSPAAQGYGVIPSACVCHVNPSASTSAEPDAILAGCATLWTGTGTRLLRRFFRSSCPMRPISSSRISSSGALALFVIILRLCPTRRRLVGQLEVIFKFP